MNNYSLFKNTLLVLAFLPLTLVAQQRDRGQNRERKGGNDKQEAIFNTVVPSHRYDIILGRPTNTSVVASILSYSNAEAYVEWWAVGQKQMETPTFSLDENLPREIALENLKPATKYYYRLYYKPQGASTYEKSRQYSFHTQRKRQDSFAFTIMADSHLDQNCDTAIYAQTLMNALSDTADFHIDLGDTFMTDKYRDRYSDAYRQYVAQRYYLGSVCKTSPLFLVLGNHDGEQGSRLNSPKENVAVWSTETRKKFFPNPQPDTFYSGNVEVEPQVANPQNYYAWEWGNALFIVLDPFRYTPRAGADDPWARTLGKVQYDWLKKTLEGSKASLKFVFIHNLVGGLDIKGKARGGSEVALFYEWGGLNADSTSGFAAHRPGWEMPIHNLLVKYKVQAVFHGHDHLFAKQDLDGVVYQCIPQPGAKERNNARRNEEYGYINGTILNGPGYLRVLVSPMDAKVDYVSTDRNDRKRNRSVVFSYSVGK